MGFPERLKYYREKAGLSQKDLSMLIGRTSGAVNNYERGVSLPRIDDIIKIIEILNVEPNQLYWDDLPNSIKKQISGTVPHGYSDLNSLGQRKVNEYIEDLSLNPKYITTDKSSDSD